MTEKRKERDGMNVNQEMFNSVVRWAFYELDTQAQKLVTFPCPNSIPKFQHQRRASASFGYPFCRLQ
jgi:hypothetical protein